MHSAEYTSCCSIFEDRFLNPGGVAQLGEHLPCKQGVMGSNPIISTNGSAVADHDEESEKREIATRRQDEIENGCP